MSDLNQTIKDIGYGLVEPHKIRFPHAMPGPNNWANVRPEDFGPQHDFELYDQGDEVVFFPVSEAALQWCYLKFPEDCPRWGSKGFKIESEYIDAIVEAAGQDHLMSETDYEDAMEELNALNHQGENRA